MGMFSNFSRDIHQNLPQPAPLHPLSTLPFELIEFLLLQLYVDHAYAISQVYQIPSEVPK
jgi:hypothetical protein